MISIAQQIDQRRAELNVKDMIAPSLPIESNWKKCLDYVQILPSNYQAIVSDAFKTSSFYMKKFAFNGNDVINLTRFQNGHEVLVEIVEQKGLVMRVVYYALNNNTGDSYTREIYGSILHVH